jgi:ABC-2 type transport system permease protein
VIGVLFRHHVRLHRTPLLPLAVGLALFEWVMTFVAREPTVSQFLTQALRAAPPQFLALLNQELITTVSPRGIIGIGYNHPFVLIMLAVWAVRVPSAALAGEVGRGTMNLVASRPVARSTQIGAALLTLLAGLTLLVAAAWLGTFAGLLGRPLAGVTAWHYLPLAAALWLLFASAGAVAILVSAVAWESGTAIAWTSGLMAGSYVLDYAARVWPRLASLRPLSLFRYYEPEQVLNAGLARADVIVFAAVAAVALSLAFAAFSRRDL